MLHETIFSATQRNIVATLFRMVTTLFQHCKNRRCESSRVTSPLLVELLQVLLGHDKNRIRKF